MEQGIAGSVATSGQILNIPDAYDNPAFNQAIDKKSGYRTRAILCLPIKCEDQVIGVIQLINKMDGCGIFTTEDEDIMMIFLSIAGPILASSHLYAQIQGKGKSKGDDNEMPGALKSQGSVRASSNQMAGFAEGDEEEEEEG